MAAAATVALLVLVRERVGRPAQLAQAGEDIDILAAGGTERLAMTGSSTVPAARS